MSAIGVIPARWASTRFPGKMLTPILGIPLVVRVVERARLARSLDEVVVATDDERIRATVEDAGARAVMTRSDHPSGTDRVAEAAKGTSAAVVVNIQGDEPLIDPELIDSLALRLLRETAWDMATAATPLEDPELLRDPSVVKVVCGADGAALYFSRAVIPYIRDEGTESRGLYRRHIGIYAYRASFLMRLVDSPPCALELAEKLEQLRALYLGGRIAVTMADAAGIGVDTPEDVKYVEQVLGARGEI
jgi:3-deoxy-manno-octulosonate cytidylyltransferase (CMP-KDO synthetase)